MKLRSTLNAAQNARVLLPKLVEKYFHAGRKTIESEQSPKDLHKFRLATKKFRYTLELFRPVYGVRLDRQMGPLREMQSTLGNLNDLHTTRKLLGAKGELEAKLQRRAKRKLKEFHQQWSEFDSDGQLKKWKTFLSRRPAAKPPARKSRPKSQQPATESSKSRSERPPGSPARAK